MVQDLISGFVNQDWVDQLDFDMLERVGDSFVKVKGESSKVQNRTLRTYVKRFKH